MVTFLITKPTTKLKSEITNNWPELYRVVRDDIIIISCNGLTEDPTNDTLYFWLKSEFCKTSLMFKRTECEKVRRWVL